MEQKFYKYEMHCHNSKCSLCAKSTPEEMARAYYEAGYSGLVITDHFIRGNTAVPENWKWEEKMAVYHNAYVKAKNAVDDPHFHVFFGIEHHYGSGKEVLTYGIDYQFLAAHPDIDKLPLPEYSKLVREYGGFVCQAHPFRDREYIDMNVLPDFRSIDAVEVFNYHNKPKENDQARNYAIKHELFMMSGGDIHIATDEGIGKAGMAFEREITTSAELVEALKNHEGRMIVNGIII